MRVAEVAKRYAKALLAAAKQAGNHGNVYAELSEIVKGFNVDVGVKAYFSNPTISADQKKAVLTAALQGHKVSETVVNALNVLGENDRLELMEQVLVAYREMLDLEEGITRGVVKSAQPLSADAQKEIEQKIAKVLNKKIVLTYEQDPKILGGVVAQVGGWTLDDSIDTHLKKLNEELNRRAN